MATPQSTVKYRDVPGFPGYRVGSDGSVWTSKAIGGRGRLGEWRQLKLRSPDGKYLQAKMYLNGVRRHVQAHRVVLMAFVGPCPPGMEGCHNDGDTLNNALSNLRWDTPSNNQQDVIAHGRKALGSAAYNAKLTEELVLEMRRQNALGVGAKTWGKRLGINHRTISRAIRGVTWKHIGRPPEGSDGGDPSDREAGA